MIKMDSKGEILVVFPAQAVIADTTCPLLTMTRFTSLGDHPRWMREWDSAVPISMSAPLVQSMKFNFYNPLVTAIVILILGIPSYFRTVTPSKARKLFIISENFAKQKLCRGLPSWQLRLLGHTHIFHVLLVQKCPLEPLWLLPCPQISWR